MLKPRSISTSLITPERFDVLAKLLRSRDPSKEAARLVILEGKTRKQATEITKLKGPSISGVVKRFREAHALIVSAYRPE